ncbi:hypothetical protein HY992_04575 [Candidatus Micrarchaeota archaeon]|nr:hypothetical protein [Candidatus Micrarchaeota archaeon]
MAGRLDELLNVRLSKQAYSFSVKKKAPLVKRFKTLRAHKLDAAVVRGMVGAIFRKMLKPKDVSVDAEMAVKVTPYMKTFGSKLLMVFLTFVIVLALAVGFLYYMVSKLPPPPPPASLNVSPFVELIPLDGGVASFGKSNSYVGFSAFRLSGKDLREARVALDLFKDPVPQKVFILKSKRDQAISYDDFKHFLKAELKSRNFDLVEVHVEQLKRLPANSNAIVVVPSGFFPASFLGLDKDGFDVTSLTRKGFVVIYMGMGFNKGAESELEGRIPPDKLNLVNLSDSFKLDFIPVSGASEGIQLLNPQYGVRGREFVSVASVHGSMSSVNFGDSGYVLFLPQTLDAGWGTPRSAAETIVQLVDETAWQQAFKNKFVGSGSSSFKASSNGSLDASGFVFSSAFDKRDSWGKISVSAVGLDNSTFGKTLFASFPITVRGDLRHESTVLPGGLGGRMDVESVFNEPSSAWVGREPVNVFLQVDGSVGTVAKIPLHEETITPTSGYSLTLPYEFVVSSGDYIVRAVDSQGSVYAQSFLHANNIDIRPETINFGSGYFTFKAVADGEPVKLRKVKIRLDGKDERVLDAADPKKSSQDPMALEYFLNRRFAEGNHTFEIEVAGSYVKISRLYVTPKNWWDNPLYLFGFMFVGLVFLIGYLLKRPDKVYYGIDVPDFPPTSKRLIPLPKETILDLFNQINRDYGWNFMPLSLKELKEGFRKIVYFGREISIGDYNLERLLDALRARGDVVEAFGLYSLKKWAGESGKSARHLSVFRRMRDACINNAIRFTDFGERKDCDSFIALGEGVFVHVYEGDKNIPEILETAVKGQTLVLFASDDEKKLFEKKLNATHPVVVSLKMFCETGRVAFSNVDEFESRILRRQRWV